MTVRTIGSIGNKNKNINKNKNTGNGNGSGNCWKKTEKGKFYLNC